MLSRFLVTARASRGGFRDVAVSLVPQAATVLSGVLLAVLLARGLGPGGLGQYALILSLSSLVTGLSDLGIGQTAIRFASQAAARDDAAEHRRILRWAFRARLMLALLMAAGAYLLVPWLVTHVWHAEELSRPMRLGLATGVLGAVAAIPQIHYQSIKRLGMNAMLSAGQALLPLLGVLAIAVLGSWSLEHVVLANFLAVACGTAFSLATMPRAALFSPKGDAGFQMPGLLAFLRPGKEEMEGFAAFMLLASLLVLLTMRMDLWLMGIFLDKSQLGLYSAASRFTLPLVMILGALNTALWPRVSAAIPQESLRLMRSTLQFSIPTAVVAVAYALIVPLMMPWIFGEAYRDAILLGQILCLRYCLALFISPIGLIGYSFGLARIYWIINLIQFGVVLVLNLLLLPRIGPLGSALAMLANEAVGVMLMGTVIGVHTHRLKEALPR